MNPIPVNRTDVPPPYRSEWPASDIDRSRGEGITPDRTRHGTWPGRSGEGADSVLPHLREQEERRKPLSDH